MKNKLNSYNPFTLFSIEWTQNLLFIVFIFIVSLPLYVQTLHWISHLKEHHCQEKSIHFDSQSEECNYCDMLPLSWDDTLDFSTNEVNIYSPILYTSHYTESKYLAQIFHFQHRGPPVI
ncbi:MAG: hypothetical protein H3C31_00280 [Brumimicrobium sp.]|nr:hypothetical protein [Brumimicrobium sp.]MCO5268077.1 hypothetical protein [Brumimicrobium sp.]